MSVFVPSIRELRTASIRRRGPMSRCGLAPIIQALRVFVGLKGCCSRCGGHIRRRPRAA